MYKDRPRIQPPFEPLDRVLEWMSVLALIVLVALTGYFIYTLPETVPIHFNAEGRPNRYGSKFFILILPAIGVFLYGLLTALNRSPHSFNYMVKITEENALRQYTLAMRFMRLLKMLLVFMFTLILFAIARTSSGNSDTAGVWMLPVILGMTMVPVFWYMYRSWKLN